MCNGIGTVRGCGPYTQHMLPPKLKVDVADYLVVEKGQSADRAAHLDH